MNKQECDVLSKRIQSDLQQQVKDKPLAPEIIHGTGFEYLKAFSDIFQVPEILVKDLENFLNSYLPSMLKLIPTEQHQAMKKFIRSLPLSKITKWRKFSFLFTNSEGKGSWLGIFFRKKNQETAQFYSNFIKCAFRLNPDIYVLREQQSSRFLGLKQKTTSVYIVEKNRSFTREDLANILMICEALTSTKAISSYQ